MKSAKRIISSKDFISPNKVPGVRQRVVRDVSFHSNMTELITIPAHLKTMGKLHGVPLLSQVMEHMMTMETATC